MTVEKFLSFWSQHNSSIIEGLVALIIFFTLFLAYRSFFAKKGADESHSGSAVNTAEIEKTLQKILESQSALGKANHEDHAVAAPIMAGDDADSAKAVAAATQQARESDAEVAQLRLTLTENQKKLEALQTQLAESEARASSAGSEAGDVTPAADGMSSAERDSLNDKLRDLEARLAEYEIISEDIADLSKYREENDELKKEIDALKAGAPASAQAAPEVAAPVEPTPAPAAAEPEVAAVQSEESTEDMIAAALAAAADTPMATDEVAAAPAVEEATAPAAEDTSLIDDELMREFEAAVAGQKSSLKDASGKAGDGSEKAAKDSDADKLMDEFETFVTKKS